MYQNTKKIHKSKQVPINLQESNHVFNHTLFNILGLEIEKIEPPLGTQNYTQVFNQNIKDREKGLELFNNSLCP